MKKYTIVNLLKYLAYCGLVKYKNLSGGRDYGRRNPRFNMTLKSVYKTAAMAAIGCENPVRVYYNYLIEKGTEEHNARNAVARYIARISYGIMKTDKKYEPYKWRKNSIAGKG